jgi:hypothetical protein
MASVDALIKHTRPGMYYISISETNSKLTILELLHSVEPGATPEPGPIGSPAPSESPAMPDLNTAPWNALVAISVPSPTTKTPGPNNPSKKKVSGVCTANNKFTARWLALYSVPLTLCSRYFQELLQEKLPEHASGSCLKWQIWEALEEPLGGQKSGKHYLMITGNLLTYWVYRGGKVLLTRLR